MENNIMSSINKITETPNQAIKDDDEILLKVQKSIKQAYKSGRKSLIDNIQLGVDLLEARKELGKRFYTVINDDVMSNKSVQRYIKLVLHTNSYEAFAEKSSAVNLNTDKRIVELKVEDIENLKDPSMNKIMKMKQLTDGDFDKVVSGDDEPYDLIQEAIKTVDKNKHTPDGTKAVNKYKHKPEGMSEADYDDYKAKGINGLITLIHKEKENNVDRGNMEKKYENIQCELKEVQVNLEDEISKNRELRAGLTWLQEQDWGFSHDIQDNDSLVTTSEYIAHQECIRHSSLNEVGRSQLY
jgi:hypothetical protein